MKRLFFSKAAVFLDLNKSDLKQPFLFNISELILNDTVGRSSETADIKKLINSLLFEINQNP
jgi:hypothetical protein